MLRRKRSIPVVVSSLFITILFSPFIIAEDPINQDQILTIWMPRITEDDFLRK